MRIPKEKAIEIIKDELRLVHDYPVISNLKDLEIEVINNVGSFDFCCVFYVPYIICYEFGYDIAEWDSNIIELNFEQNLISLQVGCCNTLKNISASFIRILNFIYVIPDDIREVCNED